MNSGEDEMQDAKEDELSALYVEALLKPLGAGFYDETQERAQLPFYVLCQPHYTAPTFVYTAA